MFLKAWEKTQVIYEPKSVLYHFENGSRAYQDISMPDRRLLKNQMGFYLSMKVFSKIFSR